MVPWALHIEYPRGRSENSLIALVRLMEKIPETIGMEDVRTQ